MESEQRLPTDDECLDMAGIMPPDANVLYDLVHSLKDPVVVEIGSWVSRSAKLMVSAGASKVYCVDTWQGAMSDTTKLIAHAYGYDKLLQKFCENIGPQLLDTVVFPLVGSSAHWAKMWPSYGVGQVDLVFIDADHDYENCLRDIQLWTPFVKPGGILCGHDYDLEGVKKAVDSTGGTEPITPQTSVWFRRV